MKNTLLTTTALALTAGAAYADGHAVDVKVGGFYNTTVAITSVDTGTNFAGTDFDGIDVLSNAEIIFKPSITLDNGIKFGAEIQLEAGSGGGNTAGAATDDIDESYVYIQGDFGQVLIGSENSAGYKMTVAAPDVSPIFAQSSSLTAFVPYSGATVGANVFRGTLGATYIENAGNNDANRITYFSPRFGGLQLGVSYARDAGQGNGAVDNNAVTTDFVDIAANYGGSFGGVDINASARYGTASAIAGAPDPEVWGAGLKLGFGGFSIGGSYAEQDGTAGGLGDGSSYDVGIGYANGPMSYSLTYFAGENRDNEGLDNVAATADDGVNRESLDTIVLAAKYKVNSNFAVSAFVANTQFEEAGNPADDVEGTVLGVAAQFSF
ncbi:porin [Amylibacter sp. SFDW26]|uniref:porin n=1 Tax=Amylibacter sp. SFDW26 TaxID=2652722 RepID=UPI001261C44D|nr:porin [Amylibacter sp. SFDW26]KAB7613480.1 porin [Amylibacter sp. SFDW26]